MYKIFYMITKFQKSGGTQCNPTDVNAKMSDYKILKKNSTDYKISNIMGHLV